MKKKLLIIFLLLLVVGGGIAAYIYSVNNTPEEEPLTAEQLLAGIFPKGQYSEFEVETHISFNKEPLIPSESGDALIDTLTKMVFDSVKLSIDEKIVGKTDGTTFYTEGESVSVFGVEKEQEYTVSWLKREEGANHIYTKKEGQWNHLTDAEVKPFFTSDIIKNATLSESDAIYTVSGVLTAADALSFYVRGADPSIFFNDEIMGGFLNSSQILFHATFDKGNLAPKELFFTLETSDEYVANFDISVFFLMFDDKTTLSMPQSIADEAVAFNMDMVSVTPEQTPEEMLETSLFIEDYKTCQKMSTVPSGNWSHMEFSFDDTYHKLGEPAFLYLSDTWFWDKEKNSFDEYYLIPAKSEKNVYLSHGTFSTVVLTIKNPTSEPLEARNCAVVGFRLEGTDNATRPKFVVANGVTWGDSVEKVKKTIGVPFMESSEENGQTYLDYLSGDLSLFIATGVNSSVTDIVLKAK